MNQSLRWHNQFSHFFIKKTLFFISLLLNYSLLLRLLFTYRPCNIHFFLAIAFLLLLCHSIGTNEICNSYMCCILSISWKSIFSYYLSKSQCTSSIVALINNASRILTLEHTQLVEIEAPWIKVLIECGMLKLLQTELQILGNNLLLLFRT